ncbi:MULTISPECIES: sporulation protein [Brevibacillus]|uniref:Sporulation protein n=1 Tax=Brevibacillus nitrificans TaxID=651560 RepID=A0A3M8CU82_9BACL|nr:MULTISPECIES: sporulation protein [Brevibacillus]MED1952262.1 sporulation protein [Brevibacillus centrosporus]RNB79356.1 sporulation protein [Brevibacillus nitrificans]
MRCLPFWKSSMAVLCVAALASVLTVGCNRTMTQEKGYGTQNLDRQHNTTIKGEQSGDVLHRAATPTEDRDGLMGRNQNPNLIIGHNQTRGYQVDLNNMETMAKSIPGVENARITLNGGNAYVTLDLVHNVTASQARNIEKQVIDALKQKIPRYDFHVTSNEGFHR